MALEDLDQMTVEALLVLRYHHTRMMDVVNQTAVEEVEDFSANRELFRTLGEHNGQIAEELKRRGHPPELGIDDHDGALPYYLLP